jgi:S-adenosylmethionine decarboxylase
MTWGYHLIVNLRKCSGCPSIFSGKKNIVYARKDLDRIVNNIVNNIDAIKYGPLVIEHFGEDKKIAGLSMYQLIETSNINAHIVDSNKNVYLDVFSCKKYNPYDVKKILINELKPLHYEFKFLERR